MDPAKESDKTYYSLDKPNSQVNPLPPKENCKLCNCVPHAHVIYWQCPLMKGFICTSCCREEVPSESNLSMIQKNTTISSFLEIKDICKGCGKNQF